MLTDVGGDIIFSKWGKKTSDSPRLKRYQGGRDNTKRERGFPTSRGRGMRINEGERFLNQKSGRDGLRQGERKGPGDLWGKRKSAHPAKTGGMRVG